MKQQTEMVERNKKLQKKLEEMLPDRINDFAGKNYMQMNDLVWWIVGDWFGTTSRRKSKPLGGTWFHGCVTKLFPFHRSIKKPFRQLEQWTRQHHERVRETKVVLDKRRTSTLRGERKHRRPARKGTRSSSQLVTQFNSKILQKQEIEAENVSVKLENSQLQDIVKLMQANLAVETKRWVWFTMNRRNCHKWNDYRKEENYSKPGLEELIKMNHDIREKGGETAPESYILKREQSQQKRAFEAQFIEYVSWLSFKAISGSMSLGNQGWFSNG